MHHRNRFFSDTTILPQDQYPGELLIALEGGRDGWQACSAGDGHCLAELSALKHQAPFLSGWCPPGEPRGHQKYTPGGGVNGKGREQTQAWPTGKRTWEHNWQGLKRGEKLFYGELLTFCQVWCDSEGGLSTPTSRHLPPPLASLIPARHEIREQNNLRWYQVHSIVAIT